MVAHWMRVGFVHGVMNTDNMSILGLTIDYGPYGWIDNFDPDWTPNTTDAHGRRYRFGQQAQIAYWNLDAARERTGAGASRRSIRCMRDCSAMSTRSPWPSAAMSRPSSDWPSVCDEDLELMQALHELLHAAEVDMTLFFRALAMSTSKRRRWRRSHDAFYDESEAAAMPSRHSASG